MSLLPESFIQNALHCVNLHCTCKHLWRRLRFVLYPCLTAGSKTCMSDRFSSLLRRKIKSFFSFKNFALNLDKGNNMYVKNKIILLSKIEKLSPSIYALRVVSSSYRNSFRDLLQVNPYIS